MFQTNVNKMLISSVVVSAEDLGVCFLLIKVSDSIVLACNSWSHLNLLVRVERAVWTLEISLRWRTSWYGTPWQRVHVSIWTYTRTEKFINFEFLILSASLHFKDYKISGVGLFLLTRLVWRITFLRNKFWGKLLGIRLRKEWPIFLHPSIFI